MIKMEKIDHVLPATTVRNDDPKPGPEKAVASPAKKHATEEHMRGGKK